MKSWQWATCNTKCPTSRCFKNKLQQTAAETTGQERN